MVHPYNPDGTKNRAPLSGMPDWNSNRSAQSSLSTLSSLILFHNNLNGFAVRHCHYIYTGGECVAAHLCAADSEDA